MTLNVELLGLRLFSYEKNCDTDLQCFVLCFPEEELRKLREETNVDSLRQELERERSKRLDLEQKMNEVLKTR